MLLLTQKSNKSQDHAGAITALFGVGLIGKSIVRSLDRANVLDSRLLPFSWQTPARQHQELEVIEAVLKAQPSRSIARFDTIWSAGAAGFSSTLGEVERELDNFKSVLSFSGRVRSLFPNASHSFHLLSSAGALFEGQKHVTSQSEARPMRPYGVLKITQEEQLRAQGDDLGKVIYRPSSVYGFSGPGGRAGLINALIQDSIARQSSLIFGLPSTMRDYVLASDIGCFIASQIGRSDQASRIFTLASGRPSTVFEIMHLVEKTMARKLIYRFDRALGNVMDNSFSPAVLPQAWRSTDLATGIRMTARALAGPHMLRH